MSTVSEPVRPLDAAESNAAEPIVECAMCKRRPDLAVEGDPPLGWCGDVVEGMDGRYTRWFCADCTRQYVRSIEAKLDAAWW